MKTISYSVAHCIQLPEHFTVTSVNKKYCMLNILITSFTIVLSYVLIIYRIFCHFIYFLVQILLNMIGKLICYCIIH